MLTTEVDMSLFMIEIYWSFSSNVKSNRMQFNSYACNESSWMEMKRIL